MHTLKIPQDLKRYPVLKRDLLQAWDSADELLLDHLQAYDLASLKILTIEDSFGALACALSAFNVTSYTDSFVSTQGVINNSQGRIHPVNEFEKLTGPYDLVLIRIPKNLSYFEDILCNLSGRLHKNSKVICGFKVKYQTKASLELLEKYVGTTRTTLAQKKSRLAISDFTRSPVPSRFPIQINIPGFERPFINYSNLFSRESLDIGTRFFLENIPTGAYQRILDLGCANGILGIAAKRQNPRATLVFSDDSAMAIQSARQNFKNYFQDEAEFLFTNCFENQPSSSVDLVLCNPPFHQGNTLGDHVSWQMFNDAKNALVPGGRLRVIGNHHLQYPGALKRLFGRSHVVAKNPKFVIVEAIK